MPARYIHPADRFLVPVRLCKRAPTHGEIRVMMGHDHDGRRRGRPVVNTLEDVGWLLLVVLLFPVAILVVGVPVALLVRLLIEIGARL